MIVNICYFDIYFFFNLEIKKRKSVGNSCFFIYYYLNRNKVCFVTRKFIKKTNYEKTSMRTYFYELLFLLIIKNIYLFIL